MRLIRDGIVDREGVEGLAGRLGYSTRQLNRLVTAEVGTGPLALARAQRSQTARVLLETTDLPDHAHRVRGRLRQRAAVQRHGPPDLRRHAERPPGPGRPDGSSGGGPGADSAPARPSGCASPAGSPFDPASVLDFLAARALPGVESLDGRVVPAQPRACPTGTPSSRCRPPDTGDGAPGPAYVEGELALSDLRDLTTAVSRCRQLLDLDADPVAVWEALRRRPGRSARWSRPNPGRRVPGAVDGFELAVRAVIGQQVSVAGARTVAGTARPGRGRGAARSRRRPDPPLPDARRRSAELGRGRPRRPSPCRPADAARSSRWPRRWTSGDVVIDAGADPAELRRSLVALPGHRPVDGRVRGHARPARPRRVHADRPRHPPGRAPPCGLPEDPGRLVDAAESLAAVAQLRHGPSVVAPRRRRPLDSPPDSERTCRMTHRPPCPSTRPIGRLVLECDGDVLIGIWLPRTNAGTAAATPTTSRRC